MKRKSYHRSLKMKQHVLAYSFLLIPLALMVLFIYYPMIFGVRLSFYDYNMLGKSVFVGFGNFRELFSDPYFWNALKNSLLYLLVVPPLQMISILLAVLVNQAIKGRNVFRILLFIPVVTPITAVAITWQWLFKERGFVNFLLQSLRVVPDPIPFLVDPKVALFAIMFVTMWKGLGYYMVIYLAGLQGIPQEFMEAARIDGASESQVFFRITIPLLKPYIMFCSIMSSIAALNVFGEIFAMTKGGPNHATETMALFIYNKAFEYFRFGYSSAAAVIFSFIMIAFTIFNLFIFKEGGIKSYYG